MNRSGGYLFTVQPRNESTPIGPPQRVKGKTELPKSLRPLKRPQVHPGPVTTPAKKLTKAEQWAGDWYRREKRLQMEDEYMEAVARGAGGPVAPELSVVRKVFVTNMPNMTQVRSSGVTGPATPVGGLGGPPPPKETARPPVQTADVLPRSKGAKDIVTRNPLNGTFHITDNKRLENLADKISGPSMPGAFPPDPPLTYKGMHPARRDIPTVITGPSENARSNTSAVPMDWVDAGGRKHFSRANRPPGIRTTGLPATGSYDTANWTYDPSEFGRTSHFQPTEADIARAHSNPARAGHTLLLRNPSVDPKYFRRVIPAGHPTGFVAATRMGGETSVPMAAKDGNALYGLNVVNRNGPVRPPPPPPDPLAGRAPVARSRANIPQVGVAMPDGPGPSRPRGSHISVEVPQRVYPTVPEYRAQKFGKGKGPAVQQLSAVSDSPIASRLRPRKKK
ncbi:hypothetical protein HK097_005277 [Rhizophlyctis rosea]|uniref:Uncharacterized protein n=1 Tax=Rhizophlyctis rosea TaxID=64517 RepID=A0AAD5WZL3_9FUNG|nr:hypothetical protein HK097_005277 [Rhizophlyctis rosea]